MLQDPEILAMSKVLDSLKDLNNWQRKRIVDWVSARFKLNDMDYFKPEAKSSQPVEAAPQERQSVPEPADHMDTGIVPESQMTQPLQPGPHSGPGAIGIGEAVTEEKKTQVEQFDSVKELFAQAKIKTIPDKILLAASYLQTKYNRNEMSAYEINSQLKIVGFGQKNISLTLSRMVQRPMPWMIVSARGSDSKQSRRSFKITAAGWKRVDVYLQ